ncbi:POT-type proton-dependent oligopeptide transporter [Novosphingobium beihaiensis]|uniref:MFS transporter n=1 Tax=Novosphingobium beihaiensis TaxID=2930389 RepID=A0ABT0BRA7_9SPHN|nr:MFS transporter [Novosphingobium beihaiensis]MCJ2187588.1 MFS transporter [Novosphingobium beihaiensis]
MIRLPRRFRYLAGAELWERFALHGVKSLLTLYLVQHVLAQNSTGVWGLAAFRSWLEAVWGPLSPSAFASQTYGLYAALTYFVLPFGGAIGDRCQGRRAAVVLGACLVGIGAACLASAWLLLPALAILILGTGLLKANLAAQVGELFPVHDKRRSGAFAIYLAFLNLGVMLGPLVCGWLAQSRGWAYAFGAAGLAMMLGLMTYLRVPGMARAETRSERPEAASPAALPGRPSLAIVAAVIAVVVLCFCAYEQVTNLFLIWIAANVRLDLGGFHIPPAWFASADGVFTIAMVLATTRLRLFARLRDGDRLALGCLALICGYGGLAAATRLGLTSIAVPLGVLALLDLGIALVWPAGLAIVTAAAPKGLAGVMAGLFYLHGFFANLVVGTVGVFYDRMAVPAFWGLHAAIAGLGLALALLVRAPVNRTGQAG